MPTLLEPDATPVAAFALLASVFAGGFVPGTAAAALDEPCSFHSGKYSGGLSSLIPVGVCEWPVDLWCASMLGSAERAALEFRLLGVAGVFE